jgi:folate-binding protein YgfZ
LVTCLATTAAPGVGVYGLLLTKQGKIVTDLFLVDDGAKLYVGVAPGKGRSVSELLDRYLVMEDAELQHASSHLWRFLHAPSSGALEAPQAAVAAGAVTIAGLSAMVLVVEEDAALGPVESAKALFALWARYGLGVFGVDFGERDNPHEASLDRVAVSWSKGCYLGQEVVCMQDMRGKVKRRLVALEVGSTPHVASAELEGFVGSEVRQEGAAAAGQVSSVHAVPGSALLLLASVATPALESQAALSVQGERVRPLERAVSPSSSAG